MTDFSPLFTPFELGKFTLPNRIVFPPMGLQVCEGGVPGEEAADYYARRAQGGASLVITEGVYIDHPSTTRCSVASMARTPLQDGATSQPRCMRKAASACRNCGTSG